MTIVFMAILFILGVSGLGYGVYQNGNAQLKADDKYYQKLQSLEAQRDLLEARYVEQEKETEQTLKRAQTHIIFLTHELAAFRPAGTLMRRNTRVLRQQQQAHGIDPDTLELPNTHYHLYVPADDLPPIQIL